MNLGKLVACSSSKIKKRKTRRKNENLPQNAYQEDINTQC